MSPAADTTADGGPGAQPARSQRSDTQPALAAPAARWTGGQFSLVRIALGAALAVHAGLLMLQAGPAGWHPTLPIVLLASVTLALGWQTRASAALALGCLIAMHVADWPAVSWSDLAYSTTLLLLCLQSGEPYLSWAARGRVDPGGDWRHARNVWHASWHVLALAYLLHALIVLMPACTQGGLASLLGDDERPARALGEWLLDTPAALQWTICWVLFSLQLGFLPVAWNSRVRGWFWLALIGVHFALLLLLDQPGLPLGLVMLHLLTFDPLWVAPRRRADEAPVTVYYDGHCGLCHRTVRLLLAEDEGGAAFRFAALQGSTFAESVPAELRAELPDSVIVQTLDGRLLSRGDAALEALARLGGLWRVLGVLLGVVPRALRDLGYDGVARVRKRIFGEPEATCPIIPAGLGQRFLP